MKKTETSTTGCLLLIGIIIVFGVWLYEKISQIGLGIICSIVFAIMVFYYFYEKKRDKEAFNELALHVFNNRFNFIEEKELNLKLMKSNFKRAEIIRNLQILRDSINTALTSKKREMAEFHFKAFSDLYDEMRQKQSGLVSRETFNEISRIVNKAIDEFHTKMYLNIATSHVEKAETLKTIKSKNRYLSLAKEVLEEGLENARVKASELRNALLQVDQAMKNPELNSTACCGLLSAKQKIITANYMDQVERAQRNKNVLPYFILSRGPVAKPCPVHGKNEGLVLPVDHDYWVNFPMREHPECKCRVRIMSRHEYKKRKVEGIQDPDAPAILNEKGLYTGHREKRLVPIKETPIL